MEETPETISSLASLGEELVELLSNSKLSHSPDASMVESRIDYEKAKSIALTSPSLSESAE